MVEPWIKMRLVLDRHPKVAVLAEHVACALGVRTLAHRMRTSLALGLLFRTWALADAHTSDGTLPGYTPEALDDELGCPGWSEALVGVGWLEVSGKGIAIPEFETHNSASSKRRATNAKRMAQKRKVCDPRAQSVRNDAHENPSAKRTGSYSYSSSLSLSEGEPEREAAPPPDPREEQALDLAVARAEAQLDRTIIGRPLDPLVEPVARAWVVYRAEIGSPLARSSLSAFLRDLEVNPEAMARRVSHAISNGYKGLPEPSAASGPAGPPRRETANQAATRRALEALEYMERALGDRPAIEDHATPRLCP